MEEMKTKRIIKFGHRRDFICYHENVCPDVTEELL